MNPSAATLAREPTRAEVDRLGGPTVLEFGASWCGVCAATQPALTKAFEMHPAVRRIRIEDGPGRPLGRSFKVKLWPTLILLDDGVEIERMVRPRGAEVISAALGRLTHA